MIARTALWWDIGWNPLVAHEEKAAGSVKAMDTFVVATYRFRHEAEFAKAVLAANDIEAIVLADDAGGYRPEIMSPVRLVVRAEDAELARSILEDETLSE